jgi:hypothetical protein
MNRYIGEPYTLDELVSGSEIYFKFNEYLNFISEYKTNAKLTKFTCNSFSDREELFNSFTDIISCILIEAFNMEGILLKIGNLNLKFSESYFLLREILEICNQIRKETLPSALPKVNEFDILKIHKLLLELKVEKEANFYICYSIDIVSNETLLLGFKNLIQERNKSSQITGFFEVYLLNLKQYFFNPFKRFNSDENEPIKEKEVSNVEYNALYKVLFFEKIHSSSAYTDLSINKKSEILSLILNESKSTINNHLRMLEKKAGGRTSSFDKANEDVARILKKFNI